MAANTIRIQQILMFVIGIKCLLLDQTMDETHNLNLSIPVFVNEWYNAVQSNIKYIRYATHPFIERVNENKIQQSLRSNESMDDCDIPDTIIECATDGPIRISDYIATHSSLRERR